MGDKRKKRKRNNTNSPQQANNKSLNIHVDNITPESDQIEHLTNMNIITSSVNTSPTTSNVAGPLYSPSYTPTYTVMESQLQHRQNSQQQINYASAASQVYGNPPVHHFTPARTDYTHPPPPPALFQNNNSIASNSSNMHPQPQGIQPVGSCIVGSNDNREPTWVKELFKKIDNISGRVTLIESEMKTFRCLSVQICDMEKSLNHISNEFDTIRADIGDNRDEINELRKSLDRQSEEIGVIREQILQDQTRSMRGNLVFYGIKDPDKFEDSEEVIRGFLDNTMNINPDHIEIDRAHRLGSWRRDKVRPIVVKFLRYKDKEAIRKAAPEKLRGSRFGINEQFPKEVADRRRLLLPILKQEKNNRKRATLVIDKLYTDDATYTVNGVKVCKSETGQRHGSQTYQQRHPINRQHSNHQSRQHHNKTAGQFGSQNANFRFNPSQRNNSQGSHTQTPAVTENNNISSGQSVNPVSVTTNSDPSYGPMTDNKQGNNNIPMWRPHQDVAHMETADLINTNYVDEQTLISWDPIQSPIVTATAPPAFLLSCDVMEQTQLSAI